MEYNFWSCAGFFVRRFWFLDLGVSHTQHHTSNLEYMGYDLKLMVACGMDVARVEGGLNWLLLYCRTVSFAVEALMEELDFDVVCLCVQHEIKS